MARAVPGSGVLDSSRGKGKSGKDKFAHTQDADLSVLLRPTGLTRSIPERYPPKNTPERLLQAFVPTVHRRRIVATSQGRRRPLRWCRNLAEMRSPLWVL